MGSIVWMDRINFFRIFTFGHLYIPTLTIKVYFSFLQSNELKDIIIRRVFEKIYFTSWGFEQVSKIRVLNRRRCIAVKI